MAAIYFNKLTQQMSKTTKRTTKNLRKKSLSSGRDLNLETRE
jgi:hypothetical protein